MSSDWEFRYVIDHVPRPGKPKWSNWAPVAETGTYDGRSPFGHRVDAFSGSAIVQFRRKPEEATDD